MQGNTDRTEVWDKKVTVLQSKKEEDAYLLHLKDLHGPHEETGGRMRQK